MNNALVIFTLGPIYKYITKFFEPYASTTKREYIIILAKKGFDRASIILLAKVVFAVPATQVGVERLFSSLKFVLSNLRYNLNENIVDDILVIRNNQ